MVLFKKKAGGLVPHAARAEHTLYVGASKQTPRTTATTGKETKAPATPGAAESRSDQYASTSKASRRDSDETGDDSRSGADGPPSVGASLRTEGSRRSAVRISRSSGMKKSSSKAKKNKSATKKETAGPKNKSATKKKTAGGPTKANKKLTRGGAVPSRPAKGGKKAAKKATPRAEPKKIAKKNMEEKGGEAGDAPEKNVAEDKPTGTTPLPKPGGVLKGCKSDDNDRNDVMENGAKAIGGLDSAMVDLAAVASGDMSHVHTYLNESIVRIRSFEGGALKMRDDLVHDSKTGLQDIGREASEWGETKKAELTEHVIPTLFADGKTFVTQGLAALAAGGGGIWNNLVVNPGTEAKDAAVGEAGEKAPAELEGSENKADEVENEEGKHLTDNIPGK